MFFDYAKLIYPSVLQMFYREGKGGNNSILKKPTHTPTNVGCDTHTHSPDSLGRWFSVLVDGVRGEAKLSIRMENSLFCPHSEGCNWLIEVVRDSERLKEKTRGGRERERERDW